MTERELVTPPQIIKHTLPGGRSFEYDPVMGLVTVGRQTRHLGKKDSKVLRVLAENPNKHIDPQKLRETLDITPSSLTNSLKRVRNALGETATTETPTDQRAILTINNGPIMFRVLTETSEEKQR